MNLLFAPIPFDEAADFIKDKPVVLRRVWDKMRPEIQARVFMVTGIEDANMAQAVRDIIAEVPRGRPWDEAKADVAAELQKLPWMDGETAMKRAELLVRHHAFMAYSAAQYEAAQEVKQDLPYWQYLSMGDEAVRDAHRRLHGLILPADHPFWEDHYPPWDWGCRCQVVPISAEDAAQAGAGRPNEYGVTLKPEQEKRLRETGMLDLGDGQPIDTRSPRVLAGTPKEKQNTWQWKPGDLRIPLDQLHDRYDQPVWDRFHKNMRAAPPVVLKDQTYPSVWDWLLEPARLKARAEVLAHGIKNGKEMAIALDYRTGAVLYKEVGTEKSVIVRKILKMARSAGQKICIEHNHPLGDMVSPKDVGVLLGNSDVVEMVAAHTDKFRYTVRKGSKFAPTADDVKAIAERVDFWFRQLEAGKVTFAEWERKLRNWEGYGWFSYEELPER